MHIKRFIGLFLLCATISAQAQLRLPHYFSDHAILQREQPIVFWGWSSPDKEVSVSLDGKHYKATTGRDSIWRVTFPARAAGGPYKISIEADVEKIAINDIYFGDVFFCSGQSNMQFLMGREAYRSDEKQDYPLIRSLHVARKNAISPLKDTYKAELIIATNKNLNHHSAVAYYFAKEIHESEKIPI